MVGKWTWLNCRKPLHPEALRRIQNEPVIIDEILFGWKSIANYLGTSVKVARDCWKRCGLPVIHIDESWMRRKAIIISFKARIDLWVEEMEKNLFGRTLEEEISIVKKEWIKKNRELVRLFNEDPDAFFNEWVRNGKELVRWSDKDRKAFFKGESTWLYGWEGICKYLQVSPSTARKLKEHGMPVFVRKDRRRHRVGADLFEIQDWLTLILYRKLDKMIEGYGKEAP